MNPPAAYHCEACPLAEAWPEASIRVAWDMAQSLARYPPTHPAYIDRFERMVDGLPDAERDRLIDDIAVIEDEVSRVAAERR